MVSIEEAQRSILEEIMPMETEKVSLFHGLNRVTPEDQIAPWDTPPADNSAMDGLAFSHGDLDGNRLKVTGFLNLKRPDRSPSKFQLARLENSKISVMLFWHMATGRLVIHPKDEEKGA